MFPAVLILNCSETYEADPKQFSRNQQRVSKEWSSIWGKHIAVSNTTNDKLNGIPTDIVPCKNKLPAASKNGIIDKSYQNQNYLPFLVPNFLLEVMKHRTGKNSCCK